MNDKLLNIESSKQTPLVCFEAGKLYMIGRSIIENPSKFYNPIFLSISQYISTTQDGITINFAFEHINTGSVKWLFVLLRDLLDNSDIANRFSVNWFFEKDDDDMEELGYIFKALVNCNFSVIQVETISENLLQILCLMD